MTGVGYESTHQEKQEPGCSGFKWKQAAKATIKTFGKDKDTNCKNTLFIVLI